MRKDKIMGKGEFSTIFLIILIICFVIFFFIYLNKDIINLDKQDETPKNISEEVNNIINKTTNKTNYTSSKGIEIHRRSGGG